MPSLHGIQGAGQGQGAVPCLAAPLACVPACSASLRDEVWRGLCLFRRQASAEVAPDAGLDR